VPGLIVRNRTNKSEATAPNRARFLLWPFSRQPNLIVSACFSGMSRPTGGVAFASVNATAPGRNSGLKYVATRLTFPNVPDPVFVNVLRIVRDDQLRAALDAFDDCCVALHNSSCVHTVTTAASPIVGSRNLNCAFLNWYHLNRMDDLLARWIRLIELSLHLVPPMPPHAKEKSRIAKALRLFPRFRLISDRWGRHADGSFVKLPVQIPSVSARKSKFRRQEKKIYLKRPSIEASGDFYCSYALRDGGWR
jgi:hypothetical protein